MQISKLQQILNQFPVTFSNDFLISFVSLRRNDSLATLDAGKKTWLSGGNYEKVRYAGQSQEIKKIQII